MGFAYLHTELGRWAMYRPCINIKQRLNYVYLRVRVSCLNPRTSERPTTFTIGEFRLWRVGKAGRERNLWLVLNDEVIQLQKQLALCRGEFNFAWCALLACWLAGWLPGKQRQARTTPLSGATVRIRVALKN